MNIKIKEFGGGLAGKILRVDLANNKIWTEETGKYARMWLGGRAINSWLLLNETTASTKWSDAENMLIFGAGCLVGTSAPGACRVSIDTISAFNNAKGSANSGGHFGAEMKYAGFDHIVISGKANRPVYLWIHDGEAEIRDAKGIWGKTTDETEEILKNMFGDDRLEIASIGPAGENMVKGSGIFCDCGQAAGGSGVGCVMGSKNLKALVVRGHGSIKVAEPQRFTDTVSAVLDKIEKSPGIAGNEIFESFRKGVVLAYKSGEYAVEMPVRNAQDEFFSAERAKRLLGNDNGVPRYHKRMLSCFGCPIGCQPFLEVNEGQYAETRGFTYWGNSILYSGRVDSDDPVSSIKFQILSNQLGLDADTASVSTAWAFECYENGLLTKDDTDGLELKWGNDDAWLMLTKKLAYRDGIGDLLADGVLEASRKLGKGSDRFIAHCKGQDTIEKFRGNPGWALGVATSPVAGHHLRGAVDTPLISGPKHITWTSDKIDNQAEAVFWQLRTREIEDNLGICCFMGSLAGAHILEATDYAELANAALGTDFSAEKLMSMGEGSYNLEKAFNTIHAGFTRKDDYPPQRFMEEPVISGPMAGRRFDKDGYDIMIDRYYELLGWDQQTSWQTRTCLESLGMEDVARKLKDVGRLIE